MNRVALTKKISNIEAELEILKTKLVKKPDFDVDEKNWKKLKLASSKARKELYQKLYGKT